MGDTATVDGQKVEYSIPIMIGYRSDFDLIGNNTYNLNHSYLHDEAHKGSSYTISFPDNDTIEVVNVSMFGGHSEAKATIKRIN